MDIRPDHPELLTDFETAAPARVRGWVGFGLGLWLVLAGGDWIARFGVFRWQDQLKVPPRSASSAAAAPVQAAFQSRLVPPQTGAGLTKMIPLPWIAARYAEFHPGYLEQRDAQGYYNAPLPAGRAYDVVMVGDSFMLSMGTQHLAEVLGDLSGRGVFNHSRPGAGPFMEMPKLIDSNRFDPPPKVVIWNLTARELGGQLFLRQPVDSWFAHVDVWASYKEELARSRLRWRRLAPAILSKSWPNTSLLAYFSRNAWGPIKLVALHAWPRDVLGAEDPQFGPMLFYRENLRVLPLLKPEVDAPGVVRMVRQVAHGFQARGVKLVVLLVPEKEQIHIQALSPADRRALSQGPELLAAIAKGLQDAGVPVVNLMPAFQAATAQGQRLYWRDDTHWNDAGIRLAAEELWRVVEPLLK